jgi:hypothetical protein
MAQITKIPSPGFVDGFCVTCKADRMVPESTLMCIVCGSKLDPVSLPSAPKPATAPVAVVERPTRAVPPQEPPVAVAVSGGSQRSPEAPPAPDRASGASSSAGAPEQRVVLPDRADARRWFAETVKLNASLAETERALVDELRRVRGLRKLTDAVLARIETAPAPPQLPAPPSPNGHGRMALGPPFPSSRSSDAASKRWSRTHDACANCTATDRPHASRGRCKDCDNYWRHHGTERPLTGLESRA